MATRFRSWLPVFVILLAACGGGEMARVRIASGPPLAWGLDPAGPIRRAQTGYYMVRPGDTLWAIASVHELDPEDLANWNGIKDPDLLFVGQRLTVRSPAKAAPLASRRGGDLHVGPRLTPPPGMRLVEESDLPPSPVASAPPAPHPPAAAAPTPVPAPVVSSAPVPAPAVSSAPAPAPVVSSAPAPASSPVSHGAGGGEVAPVSAPPAKNTWILKAEAPKSWVWPLKGKLIHRFGAAGGKKYTGIDIAAQEGMPVLAAADGVVVYADDGLPGYGKMIILRHGGSYMTAYAHNQAILVKQGERVSAGQAIAKAGQSGRVASPRLHFELRQGVKPVDPLRYLPSA